MWHLASSAWSHYWYLARAWRWLMSRSISISLDATEGVHDRWPHNELNVLMEMRSWDNTRHRRECSELSLEYILCLVQCGGGHNINYITGSDFNFLLWGLFSNVFNNVYYHGDWAGLHQTNSTIIISWGWFATITLISGSLNVLLDC